MSLFSFKSEACPTADRKTETLLLYIPQRNSSHNVCDKPGTFLTVVIKTNRLTEGLPQLQTQTWGILLCSWFAPSHWRMAPACDRHGILYWKPFCLKRRQPCPAQDDVSETSLCFLTPPAKQLWPTCFPRDFTHSTKTNPPAPSFYLMRLSLCLSKQIEGLPKDDLSVSQNMNYPDKHLPKEGFCWQASWRQLEFYRIPDWFLLEGTLKFIQFHSLPWAGTPSTTPGSSKPHPAWPWTLPGIQGQPHLLWAPCARACPPSQGTQLHFILLSSSLKKCLSQYLINRISSKRNKKRKGFPATSNTE